MSIIGGVIALPVAIAFVSVIHRAGAVEAALVTAPATALVIALQPLINRPQPLLSESDAMSTTVSSARHDPASVAAASAT